MLLIHFLQRWYDDPIFSTASALAFFETVVCGPLIGIWAFHGVTVKHLLRQQVFEMDLRNNFETKLLIIWIIFLQPIIVIYGKPELGKTKEVSVALALSSKLSNLFANQVQFLLMLGGNFPNFSRQPVRGLESVRQNAVFSWCWMTMAACRRFVGWFSSGEVKLQILQEEIIALTGFEHTKTRNVKDGTTGTVCIFWQKFPVF